ncbi:hypothetical protein M1N16_04880 [Nitrospinaceae bacterium]|nr:hypothetical protein [Nitrospinaceae bacterium]
MEPFSDPVNWEKSFKPGKFFSLMLENSLTDSGFFQMVPFKEIEPNVINKLKSQIEDKEKKEEKTNNNTQRNGTSFTSSTKTPLSQYKVRGNVLIFNPDTNPLKKGHTKKEAKFHKEQAIIQASIELVNLHTGRSLAKKAFTIRSNTGRKSFEIDSQNISYKLDQFKTHSIGKALLNLNNRVQMFIYKTLDRVPLEGDLISVDHNNNSAIINLGKANGVNVRDVFTVFSVDPEFNDPVDNVDLGDRYFRKGIIKISEVQGRFSKAQIVVGVNFTPGDLVVPKNKSSIKSLEISKIIPLAKRHLNRDKKKNKFQGDIIWGAYKGLPSLSY